jgi:hypothetical protein
MHFAAVASKPVYLRVGAQTRATAIRDFGGHAEALAVPQMAKLRHTLVRAKR